MTNLVIGLCFGAAAALALLIMWRMAERVREDTQFDEKDRPAKSGISQGEVHEGSPKIESR